MMSCTKHIFSDRRRSIGGSRAAHAGGRHAWRGAGKGDGQQRGGRLAVDAHAVRGEVEGMGERRAPAAMAERRAMAGSVGGRTGDGGQRRASGAGAASG
ncbi:Os01g0834150, partial [Oryza sativa Japonica Group]